MTWFAIRTAPGAQMPQREYTAETTRSNKGYRIVASLDPDISAVERSLSNAGFTHYMPIEKRLIRDRKKTNLWKPRRFALLLGYVFVKDVERWADLEDTPGVASVVRCQGKPLPIKASDILMLEAMEAEAEARYQQAVEQRRLAESRVTRKRAASMFPAGSHVTILKGYAEGRSGFAVGPARDGRLKVLLGMMEAEISVSMDAVQLVA